jgi:hypothetical protein
VDAAYCFVCGIKIEADMQSDTILASQCLHRISMLDPAHLQEYIITSGGPAEPDSGIIHREPGLQVASFSHAVITRGLLTGDVCTTMFVDTDSTRANGLTPSFPGIQCGVIYDNYD